MSKYSPFQRVHRRAARIALYSSTVLSALVVSGLGLLIGERLVVLEAVSRTVADWEGVREVRLLRDYLRIDTSHHELEGARWLAEELRQIGLEPEIEELGDGKANVWAILEGESRGAIVLHNHIDVFKVDKPEAWVHPPFAGVIDPPFLYGRGAFDMKSLTIAQLEAMRALATREGKPPRSVIFLATSDEESGSRLGTRWILREHPELVERFELVLTEGGIIEPLSTSEVKYWGIENTQRRYVEGWACADEREVLEQLLDDLQNQLKESGNPRLTPETAEFIPIYASTREDTYLDRMLQRLVAGQVDPIVFARLPPYLRSFFLDEIFPFPVEEAAGGGYRIRLMIHLLPGSDARSVQAEKLPAWMTHGLTVHFEDPLGANGGSPSDSPAFEILRESLLELQPDATVGPYFLHVTATDSRFFRELGIDSYGFSPFLLFNTESFRADALNERINLPGFVEGVEIYTRAVRRLVGET